MARRNPFPQREKEICARLRRFREKRDLSRIEFACKAGIDTQLLANYELLKSQLPYKSARQFILEFMISPVWLARGEAPEVSFSIMPSIEALGVGERALFSEVFDGMLSKTAWAKEPDDDARRLHLEWELKAWIEGIVCGATQEGLKAVRERVGVIIEELHAGGFYESTEQMLERSGRLKRKRPHMMDFVDLVAAYENKVPVQNYFPYAEAKGVADVHQSTYSAPVLRIHVPTIDELIARVLRAVEPRGKQRALALFLGVSQSRVTSWMQGKKYPNGEATLRLLEWVQAEEAKQQSPGSASTPPEQVTRKRNRVETKPKPGRRKK